MGMVVRTNTMAMNAQRQLGMNNNAVSKSLEKLSSGFRINRAADDASGLAISEKMKAQIKGLEQASSNSQDGISLIQTAEGATTEIHNMLNRMVELATKSANGTIQNEVDREAIQREVDDLNTEITRIAKSTNFNGINLLDGSLGGATVKNNVTPPTGGTTPPPVTTTVGSMGDATTPATFSLALDDSVLANGGTIKVGDSYFSLSGNLAPAAGSDIASGTGTESDPFVVSIEGLTKEAAMTKIASAMDETFNASGSATIGGKSFDVAVADGKITFTATANGELKKADGTNMAESDLTGSISATKPATTPPTPPSTDVTATYGTGTAGKADKAAEKAVYDLSLNGKDGNGAAWGAGDTVTVNGTTYEFVANGGSVTPDSGNTKVELGGTPETTVAAQLALLKTAVGTVEKDYAVTVNGDNNGLTFTAKNAGAVADTNAGDGSEAPKKAIAGATETTAGSNLVAAEKGSIDLTIDNIDKLSDGDKLKIGNKTFVIKTPGGEATAAAGETLVDMTGDAMDAASLKTKLDAALGSAAPTSYDVTTAVADGKLKVTVTQKTAADATVTEMKDDLVLTHTAAPASANVPATPEGVAAAAAGPAPAAAGTAPTSTMSFTSQPNAGSTITVKGSDGTDVVFEFVKQGDAATGSNIAVTIGGTLGDTMDNLETAFGANTATDVGIARDTDANGVKQNSFTITNNEAGATAKDFADVQVKGMGLKLQVGDTNDDFNHVSVSVDDLTADGLGTAGLDVSNQDAAGNAIKTIKDAINKVSTNRANLGSLQNRLEYTINNLDTTAENMTSANSRIRDTDMAKEMMNYTKMNVLTQAAQAMLAQANQQPQSILQLLQ